MFKRKIEYSENLFLIIIISIVKSKSKENCYFNNSNIQLYHNCSNRNVKIKFKVSRNTIPESWCLFIRYYAISRKLIHLSSSWNDTVMVVNIHGHRWDIPCSWNHAKARDVPAINRKRGKIEVFQAIELAPKCARRIFLTAASIFPQTLRPAMSYCCHNAMLLAASRHGHVAPTYVDRVVAHSYTCIYICAYRYDIDSTKTPSKDYISETLR